MWSMRSISSFRSAGIIILPPTRRAL
jgi:hypothetical protein